MSDYRDVSRHRSMAQDSVRNAAYERALARVVTPDSVVLDLGAGTGILGVIAARLGARRVYLVEPEDVIEVAREVAAANGVGDRVVCVHGRIEDVTLPEPVSVIVSVLTGNFLVTEDLLSSLLYARDALLAKGGALVPKGAAMVAAPVSAPALYGTRVASWSELHTGLDLSAVRPYAANSIYYEADALRAAVPLATPQTLATMDFSRDAYGAVHARQEFAVTRDGVCHGWAGWTEIDLGGERLSTSPFAPQVHWSSAFLPLDPPLPVRAGSRLALQLDRAPRGDWTWVTTSGADAQQHSTLLGAPISVETLQRASPTYAPTLTEEGRRVLDVLAACDGTGSVEAIARRLHAVAPERWSLSDALAFVQRTVRHFC